MVRNHVAITHPELTENEQQLNKFTEIHCSIFRINSGVSGWYCLVPLHSVIPDKSTLDDEIGTARLAQSVSFGINSSYCRQPVDFPATSTRSQSASWAINLDSWLSSSLQHDHQSLPKVSSSSGSS
jgi:hypothetical protein